MPNAAKAVVNALRAPYHQNVRQARLVLPSRPARGPVDPRKASSGLGEEDKRIYPAKVADPRTSLASSVNVTNVRYWQI